MYKYDDLVSKDGEIPDFMKEEIKDKMESKITEEPLEKGNQ